MMGFDSAKECLEANFFSTDTYLDKTRRQQFLDKLQKNGRVKNFEIEARRLDGSSMWMAISAKIFPERGWIEGAIRDITAEKLLTQAEMKILTEILAGKSNKLIAMRSGRSVRTIEDHRASIMCKLEVDNVVDLTLKALQCGIAPNDE